MQASSFLCSPAKKQVTCPGPQGAVGMHTSVCVHTQPTAKTQGQKVYEEEATLDSFFWGPENPPERRASVLANQKVGSFLLAFQLASFPRACFPIQILPVDLLFIAACCPNAPLGHLARSCTCRDCAGRVAVWAGLGGETHCPQHTSKPPCL